MICNSNSHVSLKHVYDGTFYGLQSTFSAGSISSFLNNFVKWELLILPLCSR